jgi:transketolase
MGRHKFNVLTDENGDVIYGEDYAYVYGKCDRIRVGRDITVVAMGPMVTEALKAYEDLKNRQPELSVEIIAASSIKQFDDTLLESIRKTGRVLTVEDHNPYSGLGGQLARHLLANGVEVKSYKHLGVEAYQLSGVPDELYESAGISAKFIAAACIDLTNPVN